MKTKTLDINLIEILNQYRLEFTKIDKFNPDKEKVEEYIVRREDYVDKRYWDDFGDWNDKR